MGLSGRGRPVNTNILQEVSAMSATNFEFEAQVRDNLGKGASRRLRREEKVLGVIYGGGEAATSIMLEQRVVFRALEDEAVYAHILSVNVNGNKQKVVLRDVQRHPYKPTILHLDFLRVSESDILTMEIPVHFVGAEKCPGVLEGGILNHLVSEIEVKCQANKLPEHIDVDVSALQLDESITLSQVKMPAGVEVVMLSHGHDLPVVSVHLPRQDKTEAEEAAELAAVEVATEEAAEVVAESEEKDSKK